MIVILYFLNLHNKYIIFRFLNIDMYEYIKLSYCLSPVLKIEEAISADLVCLSFGSLHTGLIF